jgi:hypothetical protein
MHRFWETQAYSAFLKCDCSKQNVFFKFSCTHTYDLLYRFYNSSDTDRKSALNTMPETILCVSLSTRCIGRFAWLRYICGLRRWWQHVRRIEVAGGATYCSCVCHSFILAIPAWVVYPQVILMTLSSHIMAVFTFIVNLETTFNTLNWLS